MPQSAAQSLAQLLPQLIPNHRYPWPIEHYKSMILALGEQLGAHRWLEIGGGRSPLLTVGEVRERGLDYTVNDISQPELDRSPAEFRKACFDVSGPAVPVDRQYDFIFSNMVMEHVPDAMRMHRNILQLLAPGGVALHLHPVLFSPPFVANLLLPEQLSRSLLHRFFPYRRDDTDHPKFPARYSGCFATQSQTDKIRRLGFQEATVWPFYHHGYFASIPGIRTLDTALSNLAEKNDWRLFAAYALTVMRK